VDVYEVTADLRPGVRDVDFVDALTGYLDRLLEEDHLVSWRVLRRKLGLGEGPEFKVLIEVRDLQQLDSAFRAVSRRTDPIETLHHSTNSLVTNFHAALYRDFPDPHRMRGEERF
jgi:hypothetical protein